MSLRNKNTVILDTGASTMKCGWVGYDQPHVSFPACIGIPKHQGSLAVKGHRNMFVGAEAYARRAVLALDFPIYQGANMDWDSMERLWRHAYFSCLNVAPEEHPVLITESASNVTVNREKTLQIMFETFNVPSLYMAVQSVLSLYASGRISGIVLDSSESGTMAVPVYEGVLFGHAIQRLGLTGRQLTQFLADELIRENDQSVLNLKHNGGHDLPADWEHHVRIIKESMCHVAFDFEDAIAQAEESTALTKYYTLPDGNKISINAAQVRIPEIMFNPEMKALEGVGIPDTIFNAINKSDIDTRRELYSNVVLSGGNTMFNGFVERLEKELTHLAPGGMRINVIAPEDRHNSSFVGASLLMSMPSFRDAGATFKDEYEENGPGIIHKKHVFGAQHSTRHG